MPELYVGTLNELRDNYRKIVRSGKLEIGVFLRNDKLYAYRNLCIHQGGRRGSSSSTKSRRSPRPATYQGTSFPTTRAL